MIDRDTLGRAIHAAKRVGGPWGSPCVRWTGSTYPTNDPQYWEEVEYDYNSGEFECECSAMAAHLINLMNDATKD